MNCWPPPFKALASRRVIDRPDWPTELRAFYERHEGLGHYHGRSGGQLVFGTMEADELQVFALYELEEVREYPVPEDRRHWQDAWADFRGIQFGQSLFFDAIVCVAGGHHFPTGTIVAHGMDIAGPEIDGRPMLVLGRSIADWLAYLERHGWEEWGITPGSIDDLPERDSILAHFRERNPGLDW